MRHLLFAALCVITQDPAIIAGVQAGTAFARSK